MSAPFIMGLAEFVRESNRIEGITRDPSPEELFTHHLFIELPELNVAAVQALVWACQPDADLRAKVGLNVRVGNHFPPPGGPEIPLALAELLERVNAGADPFACHVEYETLHPFTDGNGRSGRAIWLWQMRNQSPDRYALRRGFLHTFYYQSLAARSAPNQPVTEGHTTLAPSEGVATTSASDGEGRETAQAGPSGQNHEIAELSTTGPEQLRRRKTP